MLCTCIWDCSQCTQKPLSSVYFRVLVLFLGGQASTLLPSLSRLMHHGMPNALSTQENMLVNDYTRASVTTPHLQHSEQDCQFPMSLGMAFFKTVKQFCLCNSPHNLRVSKLGSCWTQFSREGTELSHSKLGAHRQKSSGMKSTSRFIVTGNCPGFLAAFCQFRTCLFICRCPVLLMLMVLGILNLISLNSRGIQVTAVSGTKSILSRFSHSLRCL